MEQKLLKTWFFILILTMICTLILAFDIRKRQAFYSNINHKEQLSTHQKQQYEKVRWPRRLPNQHMGLVSTKSFNKVTEILINNTLVTENIFDAINTSLNQSIKNHKMNSSLKDSLLLLSANNGKKRKTSTRFSVGTNRDNDDKKTLSQQVKEGKYGLIQNEIYPLNTKRPGIISYTSNFEVPHDTIKNLGGLDEEDIWFAENHVLVLKGGSFPELNLVAEQSDTHWEPIDSYKAPCRQVKIPIKPRIPPPFPVQLIEGGPIQLISTNGTSLTENYTNDFKAFSGGFKGFLPGEGPYFPFLSGTSNNNNNDVIPALLGSQKNKMKADGVVIPFYPVLPSGTAISSSPSNQSDYDEDQSIYYPPSYSFIYSQDNSTAIPPGPLVPGIILPPPPDFFSSLNEKNLITNEKHSNNPSVTFMPTLNTSYLAQKSSTKFINISLATVPSIRTKISSYYPKPFVRIKLKNSTFHQYQSEKVNTQDYQSLSLVELTTSIPFKSTTLENSEKYNMKQILGNQIIENSTRKTPWKAKITSKAIPLVTFFATTTATSIQQLVETTPLSIKNALTTENPIHYSSHGSYYFYEESNNDKKHSSTPGSLFLFSTTTKTPPYYKFELSQKQRQELKQDQQQQKQQKQRKEYYEVKMIPPPKTTINYNIKLIDSIVKDPLIYHYLESDVTSSTEKLKVLAVKKQNPRILYSEPRYYQSLPTQSIPKLNYFTTPNPKIYYQKSKIIENFEYKPNLSKSKPIYQYSFEAANYAKQKEQMSIQKPQIFKLQNHPIHYQQINESWRQKKLPLNNYQNIQNINGKYEYENSKMIHDQKQKIEKVSYFRDKKNERQSYYQLTTTSPVRFTTLSSHEQYFTKQDEQLLDDVTKEYFTIFGKKLSRDKQPSTTPLYGKSSITNKPQFNNYKDYESTQYNEKDPNSFKASNIKVNYGNQTPDPLVLKDDIFINYKQSLSLPTLNPNSDFISLIKVNPQSAVEKYKHESILQLENQVREYAMSSLSDKIQHFDQAQNYDNGRLEYQKLSTLGETSNSFISVNHPKEMIKEPKYTPRPFSFESDISINYKNLQPSINPNAKLTDEGIPDYFDSNINKANSYFSYRLPGNGGHFYFFTPQTARRKESNRDYLYARNSRLLKKRK